MPEKQEATIEVGAPQLLDARDEMLQTWFTEQAQKSPDNLEAAARQILTLCTSLLTLLFAALAVAGDPLPGYLRYLSVRLLGILAVLGFLIALAAALAVIYPFPWQVNKRNLSQLEARFEQIVGRKSAALKVAVFAFGGGMVGLGLALVLALWLAGA
jgi:hypothetical protein